MMLAKSAYRLSESKKEEITHTIANAKVSLGLISHIQARLLARHLRGDLPNYQPFIQR